MNYPLALSSLIHCCITLRLLMLQLRQFSVHFNDKGIRCRYGIAKDNVDKIIKNEF